MNEILSKYKKSEGELRVRKETLDIARSEAGLARTLIYDRRNKVKAISDQFGANSAENLSSEGIDQLLVRMDHLQKEIEALKGYEELEAAAKVELDAQKQRHKVWERKVEALDLVVDDPVIFEATRAER